MKRTPEAAPPPGPENVPGLVGCGVILAVSLLAAVAVGFAVSALVRASGAASAAGLSGYLAGLTAFVATSWLLAKARWLRRMFEYLLSFFV
ncbi:MAG TPA: hypothetical protein PK970_06490 [Hyphomicrobiaceae bacterium]|nr:hypothetical protein [Hyphomicrobiaceae bacterium]